MTRRRACAICGVVVTLVFAPAPAFAGLNLYTLVLGTDPANGQANLTSVFTTSVADLEGQAFEILIAQIERQGNGYSAHLPQALSCCGSALSGDWTASSTSC